MENSDVSGYSTAADVDADDGTIMLGNCIWTPGNAKELRQCILIMVHCGGQGYRELNPMVTTIGGNVISRPWGPTYNATERNEMLRWDYMFLGDSFDGNKYLLMI
ncbi:Hypothetical protein PHPALM_9632 [Phytophthora palmivora]|uniref:Uncharacterized protein n=1 Tax=Phytophthora palmivora TaxID=4796 RepID=A0A2P4Y6T1_9STRA|nr:Hypothetical protein PHPALM_9632 [Phytophthora palmivora]